MSTYKQYFFILVLMMTVSQTTAWSQLPTPGTRDNKFGNANDSAGKKTNTNEWENEDAYIYYTKSFSNTKQFIDTSIHQIHRRPFSQPWQRDLGNLGSPSQNLQFSPKNPIGLSLGYHSFDALRYHIDSLKYFNTTKPYSDFTYNLASKLEQVAQIFHTQNIKPNWNMAVNYRKINSPGYYYTQRNNHDNFFVSNHFKSLSQQYELYAGITYNKEQHDENGGIVSDTFFNNQQYADRKSIPVNFFNSSYSSVRSPVSTLQRDFTVLLDQAYTWGKKDTTYNNDSTQYELHLTPRFRISHRLEAAQQRYQYKDMRPDSLRYDAFFKQQFATADSVFSRQEWFYVDNRLLINGLVGKANNQLLFNAGVGNRIDKFSTNYLLGKQEDNVISNYLVGKLSKEATKPKQWAFEANTKLFVTGAASGNFGLDATLSKDLGNRWGVIKIGANQQLNNAPYNYSIYQNQYWQRSSNFDKESSTHFYASIQSTQYKLSLGANNYLLGNYLYFDANQSPSQSTSVFTVSQFWLRKVFSLGPLKIDNEILYQQTSNAAPLNVPKLLGRHQLSIETKIFKNQLRIATGLEIRYHSAYYANGYSPFFNQFYLQNSYQVANTPDASLFFNFNIKRFRSYIMVDQVPQLFNNNIIIAPGYAAQNTMLRFGFSWVMVN